MGVYRSIRKMDLAADKMNLAKELEDEPLKRKSPG
jgi:hypothetical protein